MEEFAPNIKQQKRVTEVKAYDKTTPLNEVQKKLVEQGYKQVKTIAGTMFYNIKNENTNFQLDDFVSWGAEGLVEAAQKFNSSLGFKFDTYAGHIIRGRILDNLRDQSIVSRHHLKFLKDREKATESLHKELKRKPTEEEIAGKIGLTLEKYFEKLKRYSIGAGVMSLTDATNDNSSPETDYLLDKISQEINPYGSEDNKEFTIDLLKRFLDQLNLNEKERQIINMYFIEELTEKEIGEKLGVTESRISQIKSEVIKKLKKLFEKQGYKGAHAN